MTVLAEMAQTNEQTGSNKLCELQDFFLYKPIPLYEAKKYLDKINFLFFGYFNRRGRRRKSCEEKV